MKIQPNLTLLILVLMVSCSSGTLDLSESKRVWVFWNTDISQAPEVIQLCYEKIQKTCKEENWQLMLLNEHTYMNYIQNQDKFLSIVRNKKKSSYPALVDLIRLTILADRGGLWIDISSVLFSGLSWLQHLDQSKLMIANRKKGQEPQVVLFYLMIFQQRNEIYTSDHQMVNMNPGYQMWFVYCKPKAQLMAAWRDTFSVLYQQTYEENYFFLRDSDTYLNYVEVDDYLIVNQAIYHVMQKKQLQLDKSLELFGQRQNANQYYKVWGLPTNYGPLTFLAYGLDIGGQMMLTLDQIKQNDKLGINFFIKMTASKRKFLAKNLDKTKQFMQTYGSFDAYLQAGLSKKQCLYNYFIAQGSAFQPLLKDSKVAEKNKYVALSPNQVSRWVEYCNKKLTITDRINTVYAKNLLVKVFLRGIQKRYEYTIANKLYQNSTQFVVSWIFSHSLYLVGGMALALVIFLLITLMSFWRLGCQSFLTNNIKNRVVSKNAKYFKTTYFSMLFFSAVVQMKKFFCGEIQKQYDDLALLTIIILITPKITQFFEQNKLWFDSFCPYLMRNFEFSQTAEVLQVYFIGKIVLSVIVNRNDWLPCVSLFVFLIGFALFKLAENLKNSKIITHPFNLLLSLYLYSKPYLKYIGLGFFTLMYILPNLQYVVFGETYAIRNFSYLFVFYVLGLYGAVGYQFWIELRPIVNSDMSQKNMKKWLKPTCTYFYLVFCGFYSQYIYQNFIKLIGTNTLMIFDPTIAFIFIGLNTQYFQKSIQNSTNFQTFLLEGFYIEKQNLSYNIQIIASFLPQILLFFLMLNCDQDMNDCRMTLILRMLVIFALCIIQVNFNSYIKVKKQNGFFDKLDISSKQLSFQQLSERDYQQNTKIQV